MASGTATIATARVTSTDPATILSACPWLCCSFIERSVTTATPKTSSSSTRKTSM
jgi:hypothetical protein